MIKIYQADAVFNDIVKGILNYPMMYNYDDPQNIWSEQWPELRGLRMFIIESVETMTGRTPCKFDGWCVTTINSNTHLLKHNHTKHADIVANYYVINDNPVGEGDIIVYHPDGEMTSFHPEQGSLLLFPGSWDHRVTPYTGMRLSIATNIRL